MPLCPHHKIHLTIQNTKIVQIQLLLPTPVNSTVVINRLDLTQIYPVGFWIGLLLVMTGALKMQEWKKQEWKNREQIARLENAGLEKSVPDFSTPAFSSPAICSRLFRSCIFQPCIFDRIAFSTPAFSVAPSWPQYLVNYSTHLHL